MDTSILDNYESYEYIKNIKGHLDEEYLKVSLDFFIMFSRFEYALKTLPLFSKEKETDYGKYSEANWTEFTKELAKSGKIDYSKPEKLKIAKDYLINNPPYKLLFSKVTNKLEPEENKVNANYSETKKLREHIKLIRNNLFHGGKYTDNMIEGSKENKEAVKRNILLIKSAMIVLDNWLDLCSENSGIKERFNNI
ncbi:hypothetical protein [Emticicia sp. 17c]|uniref:hypothetical protein n=1 Tax=Emticicia sp. 17c TaxID=3127704 RepID=UPI00301D0052